MNEKLSETEERARLREWIDNWAVVGRFLEEERLSRLQAMTDDEARQQTAALFELWRPSNVDHLGVELVTQQRWFLEAARRTRRR